MSEQQPLPVDLPQDRLSEKQARKAVDAYIRRHFLTNEHGIWCPNCQERIDDFWPASCDHCGWPSPDHDRYDEDDWQDHCGDPDCDMCPPASGYGGNL